MKRRRRLLNDGFSLVEIIVVVAITVVLMSLVLTGISVLNSRPVDECAQKLQIALESNRTTTMGKLSAYVDIYKNSEGYIVAKEVINGSGKETIIGDTVLDVEYYVGGVKRTLPTAPGALTISFERSSGSLKAQTDPVDNGKYVEKFVVSRGDKKMEVIVEWLTGRVSIN